MKVINRKRVLFSALLLFFLALVVFLLVLHKEQFASFSCRASGKVYINGYKLSYVSRYQFTQGAGLITLSGKVFKEGRYLGILGRQIKVSYINNGGLYTLTNKSSLSQMENSVSPEDYRLLIPPVYYEEGRVQNITVTPVGKGYRLEYNAFPFAMCY
ncbi:hypothetical protein PMPD1_3444 [Paramixta manurensis]|uniref:Uncharacterized protein n=1 Tax=Paramixta manurensis TaxID=2740817 RepID=A0A6M8UHK0_9GAMM|nr:hypothetical protein PMPD1_3444 [Erwiniaceae bacterium PD-1]